MELSQLTKLMDEDDEIIVGDLDAPIDEMELFSGKVKELRRDNPINKGRVTSVCAANDTMLVTIETVENCEKKEGHNNGI